MTAGADDGWRAITGPPELVFPRDHGAHPDTVDAAVSDDAFQIALIPHTLEVTAFGDASAGDAVNLEVDILAKYVERLLEAR